MASDAELLAAVRAGDEAALDELLRRHEGRIFRFGRRLCGDPEAAAEVLQETMLAVARHASQFRGDADFTTWLWTVARRNCGRMRRRRAGEPESMVAAETLPLPDPGADPEADTERAAWADHLARAIDQLEPGQREVVLLRDVEGMTAPEVARVLDISVGAVKSRLHRARTKLRKILAPLAEAPPPTARPDAGPCFEVERAMSEMLEGDLAAAACERLQAHVDACPRCAARCKGLSRVLGACRAAAPEDIPDRVRAAVREAVIGTRPDPA